MNIFQRGFNYIIDFVKGGQEQEPMRFEVGEGLSNTTTVLPGPRISTLDAMKRGEDIKVVKPTEPTKIAPKTVAKATVQKSTQIAKAEESQGMYKKSNAEVAKDVFLSYPKKVAEVGKMVAQAPVRAVTSVGLEAPAAILSLIQNKKVEAKYTPKTTFEKMVFGEEPIRGIFTEEKDVEKKSNELLQKIGIDKNTAAGMSLALAPLFVGGLKAIDITPIGGDKKLGEKIFADIAKSKNPVNIARNLAKFGIESEQLANDLVKVVDPNEVKSVLKTFQADEFVKNAENQRKLSQMDGKVFHLTDSNEYIKLPDDLTDAQKIKLYNEAENISSKEKLVHISDSKVAKEAKEISLQEAIDKSPDFAKTIDNIGYKAKEIPANKLNINIERYGLDTEEKNALNLIIDNNAKQIQGDITPTTLDSIVQRANKESQIMQDSLSNDEINNLIVNEVKIRQRETTLTKIIEDVATSPADKMAAQKELIGLLEQTKAYNTLFGRGLSAKRIIAEGDKTISQEIIDRIVKTGAKVDDVVKKAGEIDWQDANAVNKFYREFVKPTWGELWDEFRYNNLLSSPKTQGRNIISGIVQGAVIRPATKAVNATLNAITSIFSGKRENLFKEIPIYYYNFFKSIPDAAKVFKDAWTGKRAVTNLDLPSVIQKTRSKVVGVLTLGRTPTKLMESADQFLMKMISEGEKAAQMSKGISEEVAQKSANEIASYNLFRGNLTKENAGVVLNAIDSLTNLIMSSRNAPYGIGKIAGAVVPFVKIPMNFLKSWVEYSPLGITTLVGNTKKTEQLAKTAIGSAVSLWAYQKAMSEDTTWGIPKDEEAQKLFFAAGKKPYSVKININGKDRWIPMIYFGSLAYAMALPAAIKYYQYDNPNALTDTQVEKIGKMVGANIELLSQQTFLENIGNMIDVINGTAGSKIEKNLAFMSSQAVPLIGLQRYVSTVLDDVYRKSEGFVDEYKRMIPWLSKSLPPHTTPTGEVSKRDPVNKYLPWDIGTAKKEFDELLKLREEELRASNYILEGVEQNVKDRAIKLMDDFRNAKTPQDNEVIAKQLQTDPKLNKVFVNLIKKQAQYMEATIEPYKLFKDDPKTIAEILYTRFIMAKTPEDNKEIEDFIKELQENKLWTKSSFKYLKEIMQGEQLKAAREETAQ